MGWHCSDTAELSFTDVRVPVSNLVGEENGGFLLLMQQFVNERLGLALQGHATAQRALDLAAKYARERETFGKPLRSEEHTSELQSLMRISYAVFCLKKKRKKSTN